MQLALVRNKHNLSASRNYLGSVYETFTAMCEEQTYTDLTLVTSDGKAFGVHKVRREGNLHYYTNFKKKPNFSKLFLIPFRWFWSAVVLW